MLCEGKLDNSPIVRIDGINYVPNYPPTDADSRILSIAKALDHELDIYMISMDISAIKFVKIVVIKNTYLLIMKKSHQFVIIVLE